MGLATAKTLVITAITSFEGNPHDSDTMEPLPEQLEDNGHSLPAEVVYDRGGEGEKQIGNTRISTPDYKPLKRDTDHQKKSKRKKFRRRSAIEPVIGHLKTDFRMGQNYLWSEQSPQINAFLAATGWNLKKLMRQLSEHLLSQLYKLMMNFFYPKLKLN